MIPFDTKNYRARREFFTMPILIAALGIVALVMLLGWIGERDHQAKVEQVRLTSIEQCTD